MGLELNDSVGLQQARMTEGSEQEAQSREHTGREHRRMGGGVALKSVYLILATGCSDSPIPVQKARLRPAKAH